MGAGAALADPVTWTLQGVTLNDGGTASGSFTYDADIGNGTFSNVNIVTVGGTQLPGATYFTLLGGGTGGGSLANGGDVSFVTAAGSGDGQTVLFLDFQTNLTDAGGSVALTTGLSGEATCFTIGVACDFIGVPGRVTSAGTVQGVVAAPVPTLSEWAMILFGLMLAGGAALYIQRRQLIA